MLFASIAFIVGILLSRRINQTISKVERNIHGGQIVSLEDKEQTAIDKFFKKPNGHIEY